MSFTNTLTRYDAELVDLIAQPQGHHRSHCRRRRLPRLLGPLGVGAVTTVDYLGPATPETRAEVKAARRAEQRKATKELVTRAEAEVIERFVAGDQR